MPVSLFSSSLLFLMPPDASSAHTHTDYFFSSSLHQPEIKTKEAPSEFQIAKHEFWEGGKMFTGSYMRYISNARSL